MRDYTDVIIKPIVSEKSVQAMENRMYIFEVAPSANKIEIKKAVEDAFRVKVQDVNIIRLSGKSKMFRGQKGKTKGVKKAIVKLKEGYKIEIFEAS